MNSTDPIGIFDSGIGGVTVLKELQKILPNENYIYYSDSKNNPYGNKTKQEVITICEEITSTLIEQKSKAIVIACNTASAKAAKQLRENHPEIPIIAIEPAYKMVHDFAYDKPSLVMATKGTIESEKFNLLYQTYNNHQTYLLPCVGLADAIEEGNRIKIKEVLRAKLKPFQGKIENVVLGCTHYPLVKKEIVEILGNVTFFDGSPKVAWQAKKILIQQNLLSEKKTGTVTFIDSTKGEKAKQKKQRFEELIKQAEEQRNNSQQ